MDKILKISIVIGILIVSISLGYYLFYRPFQKNYKFEKCLKISESLLKEKQDEINIKIRELEEEKIKEEFEADKKREEFLKDNPEPEKIKFTSFGEKWIKIKQDDNLRIKNDLWLDWSEQYDGLLIPVRDIEVKLRGLKEDLEIIEIEKQDEDDICYKKYK